jgi:23S rRNA pseudouridine2605 synthase
MVQRERTNRSAAAESPQRNLGLARALSKLGYCSRSRAEQLIRGGHVRINGVVRKNAEAPVHIGKDRLEIDGEKIAARERIYLLLNKPRGVVTTAGDEQGRATIYNYLDKNLPWIAPVGRLDKASEGLLLVTNDSEWGARITAPESRIAKTYHVQVAAQLSESDLRKLQDGFKAADGEFLQVSSAQILRHGERNSWVQIILQEGRNRHIRRMFEGMGISVLRLVRVAIGDLQLGELAKGAVRELTAEDRLLLFKKTKLAR